MNYLAHAYLSFGETEILVGNIISDFVKGKKRFSYAEGIQKGITLHRQIDRFSDEHEATREAKTIFQPHYRSYSGAFVDVVFDHFLATDKTVFSETQLGAFAREVYTILTNHQSIFPERFSVLFPYMQQQNWLLNYHTVWGTEKSFGGLARRARYIDEVNTACNLFEAHYHFLKDCYRQFFPDVKAFAHHMYEELMSQS
ncbi:MAG: DUF479 domain-containing protein [Chitinophagaceae bacterium]